MRQGAKHFKTDASNIQKSFVDLRTDFGIFTGSFDNWAKDEQDKNDPEIEQLKKDIKALKSEIDEIKSKMIIWDSAVPELRLGS